MDVTIRRIDTDLPLPEYKTPGSVAMDCVARVAVTVEPGALAYIPLNICIKPPEGHFVFLAARSSLHKRGLFLANSVGIFDEDFSGDGDEYVAAVYNYTQQAVVVDRGDRLVQILVLPYERVAWHEVETMGHANRGGYGSTGVQ
jgi:dUTP pyrophosphatase